MRLLSLFAGVGGFDLGFERAGMECVMQCEIDGDARSVLERHWPDVPKHDDIRTLTADMVTGPVDVVCGGFPCQDLSVAGKRAGLGGARSGLFYEMVRLTNELQPTLLVWENVPGLLSSDNGRDFARVLSALDGIGYCGAWTGLDSRYFGLAQRRRRIFGVFARRDIGAGACAEILALGPRLRWHPAEGGEAGEEVAGTLGGGSGKRGQTGKGDGAPLVFGGRQGGARDAAAALNAHAGRMDFESENFVVAGTLQAGANRTGGTRPPGSTVDNADTLQVAPGGVRRLTPLECERLQGFPDGWTDGQSDSARYRQMGNAVSVPVVEWIGRRIVAVLGGGR